MVGVSEGVRGESEYSMWYCTHLIYTTSRLLLRIDLHAGIPRAPMSTKAAVKATTKAL